MNPKYPVYIISKGRANTRLTSNALEEIKVPYRIVIEPQEYSEYAAVIDPKKILVLPFSNLGQGSIPARNWVWEHSITEGHDRHWILDDNICNFLRLHMNRRVKVTSGTIFKIIEDFADRYENVAMTGMNYRFFVPRMQAKPPFYMNTRIYSCILIKNDILHRWKGRYNEDTNLSLDVLKDGYCTILFNAFLADKVASMQMAGGNTTSVYADDNRRYNFVRELYESHPDVVVLTQKFNRWHHNVDYSPFRKNKLILKEGVVIPNEPNNYGLVLVKITENELLARKKAYNSPYITEEDTDEDNQEDNNE